MKSGYKKTSRIIEQVLSEREDMRGNAREDVRRLWREYLAPHKRKLLVAMIMTALWSMHIIGFAFVGRFAVDHVFRIGSETEPGDMYVRIPLLWLAIAGNTAIWVIYLTSYWLSGYMAHTTGQQIVYRLRQDLHTKLQALHIGFFEKVPTGRIMSRVLDDVHVIQQWTTSELVSMGYHAAALILGSAILIQFSPRLSLLVFVSLPFYALAFIVLQPAVRRANIAARRIGADLYGLTAERIGGIRVVKAFGQERSELRTFTKSAFNGLRVNARIVLYQRLLALIAGLISALTSGAAIFLAMQAVRDGDLTLGTALAFIALLASIFGPVGVLTNQFTALQSVFVVLRRVFSILDAKVDVTPGSVSLRGISGKLRFDHVTFRYPGQPEAALKDVDFEIQPGERIAVMGPSGAGKTTLFNLLLRFYDPQAGEIRVGGINLAEASSYSIRQHICMVQQEPTIFSGTIAENIMYGRLDCTPSQVIQAATQSELHEFIMTLPHKYETETGESGVTLSGGQKQRLALATALLTQPEVLLLDDTTSALDAHTEARIRETLVKALKGRTSLIITQRIATARDCDRIIVLENGKISKIGAHTDLTHTPGFYQEIHRQQDI